MSIPMDNSDKLLDAIKTRGVTPKPRWQFKTKNILYWSAYGIFVLLGSVAFSIIIFAFLESDFDLLSYYPQSVFTLLLKLLPIFWIICSILFIGISLFGIRHTKLGYRYSLLFIVSTSIAGSMVLGVAFFFTGGAEKIELILANNIRLYRSVEEKKIDLWSMPEDGFLAGKIVTVGDRITIEDFVGEQWNIDVTNAFIRPGASIKINDSIKIIGKIVDRSTFIAEEIRPWDGRGNQRGQQHRNL